MNNKEYEERIKKLEESLCWQEKLTDMWRNKFLDLYNGKDTQ